MTLGLWQAPPVESLVSTSEHDARPPRPERIVSTNAGVRRSSSPSSLVFVPVVAGQRPPWLTLDYPIRYATTLSTVLRGPA
jgi:hypothetical protein